MEISDSSATQNTTKMMNITVEDTSEDHTEKSTFGKTNHTVPNPPSATREKLVESETVDVGTQVDFLTIAEGSLQEVTVAGENSFIFKGSTPQDLAWEQYGFLAHICTDAFCSDQVHEVVIKVLVAGKFKFPPGSVLVSAVYAVVLSNKPQHPIKVKLQHCVDIQTPEQARCLRFVRANCKRSFPYTFKALDNGTFNVGGVYGSILCQKFSLFAIVYDEYESNASLVTILPPLSKESLHSAFSLLSPTTLAQQAPKAAITCFATVYYSVQPGSKGTKNITFVVSKNLSALKQYAKTELKDITKGPDLTFSFKEECVTLNLEKKKEVDGWLILLHQYPCQVRWRDVEKFGDSVDRLPNIMIVAYPQPNAKNFLHHEVLLNGTVEPDVSFFIYCEISNTPEDRSATEYHVSDTELTMEDFFYVLEAVVEEPKWNTLAIALGINPVMVEDIERTNQSDSQRCKEAMVKAWLSHQYASKKGPPTWKMLVQALESRIVRNKALAIKVAKDHLV